MKNVNIHEATEKTSAALPINCRESILPCKTFHEFVTIIDMSLKFFFLFHLHKEWEYKPCTLICVHSAGRWALRNTWFVSPLFCIHTVSFFLPPNSTFPKSVSVDTWMPFLFFWRSSKNVDLRGPEKAETLKQDKVCT